MTFVRLAISEIVHSHSFYDCLQKLLDWAITFYFGVLSGHFSSVSISPPFILSFISFLYPRVPDAAQGNNNALYWLQNFRQRYATRLHKGTTGAGTS